MTGDTDNAGVSAGSCVCNEANLSGEAMPVQKRQCPSEDLAYSVEEHGSRYTLLSSTTVLQAGTNEADEVLAVVTATGTNLRSYRAYFSLSDFVLH